MKFLESREEDSKAQQKFVMTWGIQMMLKSLMQEDAEVFQAAMREAGEAFIQAAEWVLLPANAVELGFGGGLEEYSQFVCTSAGIWGVNHLQTLSEDRRNVFLHLVSFLLRLS